MGKVQRKKVDFGPWEPDKACLSEGGMFNATQTMEACNAFPAAGGFVSFEKPVALDAALPSRAYGAYTRKQFDGTLSSVVGTADGIYSRESGEWVSKYSTASLDTRRAFQEWGNDLYCLYGATLLSSTFSGGYSSFAAVTDAPTARCIGVIRDFLVLGNVSEIENGVSVNYPNAIHWSAIDDPTTWPVVGSNDAQYKLSDRQIFPTGGKVQAVVGGVGGVDGLIFLEEAVQRATYVGAPYIFQFDPVDRSMGTCSPLSPVVCNTTCLYLTPDGWKQTDGSSVKPVGKERIDKWFFDTVNMARLSEVRGVHDKQHGLAVWAFPSQLCPDNHNDRLLFYNYSLDKWSYAKVDTEIIYSDYARGMTLEQLDSYSTSIDALPFKSLDVSSLRAGHNTLNCIDTAHTPCVFGGDAMEAVIDTAEMGGERMLIHGIRPLVDRGDAQALPFYRDREAAIPKFGEYRRQSRDGVCYCHRSTAYCSARVMIPEGESWKNAIGCEILYELEGGL